MATFPNCQTNAATDAQIRFGLTLVQRVALTTASGNVTISPLGVLAAFALALSGASGTTRTALAAALFGSSGAIEEAEVAFAGCLRQLLHPERYDNESCILTLATSLWANKGFLLAPAFISHAQTRYEAQAHTVDFSALTTAPRINGWVKAHTQGRIEEIISAADLLGLPEMPPELVLLNAIYFQAKWENEFDIRATRVDWFRRANGTRQEAKFMQQVSKSIGYQAGDGWRAISLSYSSYPHQYALRIFMPDAPDGLPAFVAGLDETAWARWHKNFQSENVEIDLALPRFRIEWGGDLVPALWQMGMADALEPGADFSAMGFRDEDGGGFIGSVLHKTYLAVDEAGTEAAAVTAILWMAGGMPPAPKPLPRIVVKVDSPFFYAIVDEQDGTMIFAGTVNELIQA